MNLEFTDDQVAAIRRALKMPGDVILDADLVTKTLVRATELTTELSLSYLGSLDIDESNPLLDDAIARHTKPVKPVW